MLFRSEMVDRLMMVRSTLTNHRAAFGHDQAWDDFREKLFKSYATTRSMRVQVIHRRCTHISGTFSNSRSAVIECVRVCTIVLKSGQMLRQSHVVSCSRCRNDVMVTFSN